MKEDIRQKIIDHARTKYASSPHEFTEEEIGTIIDSECKCDRCGKSVFKLYDFPEIRDNEVFCEDCYTEYFMSTCPVCEEHYEPDEKDGEYFFITKHTTEVTKLPIGMYRVLSHPFYYGDCVTGFDGIFKDAIEQINDLNIEELKNMRLGCVMDEEEVETDMICPECAKKYMTYTNLMTVTPTYCILHPKFDEEYRQKYGPKELRLRRQIQTNINITVRGMLERANNPKYKKVK